MKRTVIAVSIATGALILAPTVSASAAQTHPHKSKAAKKADRGHDRRVAHRAAKAALKPAQETTTIPALTRGTSTAGGKSTLSAPRGVVSCAVTSARAGASFTITNGCDTQQTVVITVQAQPGPWHRGLCRETQGCHLIRTITLTIQPGTRTWPVDISGGCWVQVDVKWDGRLIRSNHHVTGCDPVKVTPHPVHPVPPVLVPHVAVVPAPRVELAYTGMPAGAGIYGAAGLGLLLAGSGLRAAGRKRSA